MYSILDLMDNSSYDYCLHLISGQTTSESTTYQLE